MLNTSWRYVHGYCVVLPVINAQDLAVSQVLDFNPHCKPSSLPSEPNEGSTRFSTWITEPYIFPHNIFMTRIVTRLPYHHAVFKEPGHHSGFIIDSHRLVGLMVCCQTLSQYVSFLSFDDDYLTKLGESSMGRWFKWPRCSPLLI